MLMDPKERLTADEAIQHLWAKLHQWWEVLIFKVPNIVLALVVLVLSFIIARSLSRLLRRFLRKHLSNQSMRRLIVKLIRGLIIIAGFFIALDILNLDKALTSLLAGAGVIALAIGLALQGTLSNIFSGIMLSALPRIRIGDYIETEKHAGFVHEISLRNLVLRRPDNHFVIMPNAKFIEEPFVNFSLVTRARITIRARVAYGSDLRSVTEMVRGVLAKRFQQQEGEYIEFYYTEFGESAILFMARFWIDYIKKSQMYAARHEAVILIYETLQQNGITIPFPISTIYLNAKDEMPPHSSEEVK